MKLFLTYIISLANSLKVQPRKLVNVCVVGANSGLGKELIYQSAIDRNNTVLGLYSTYDNVIMPYRGGGLEEKTENLEPIKSDNIILESYWDDTHIDYEHIIFCTSSKPFTEDYSDKLTEKYLQKLSDKCKTISLISAYGVGDSKEKSSLGIKLMDAIYLKDVYRAKNIQEDLINYNSNVRSGKIKKFIYRPKVLSYGKNPFIQSTSREELAKKILNNIFSPTLA